MAGSSRTIRTAYAFGKAANEVDPGFERLRDGDIDWMKQVPLEFGRQQLHATLDPGRLSRSGAQKILARFTAQQLRAYATRTQIAGLGLAIIGALDVIGLILGRRWIWTILWVGLLGVPLLGATWLQWQKWSRQAQAMQSLHHHLTGEGEAHPRYRALIEWTGEE